MYSSILCLKYKENDILSEFLYKNCSNNETIREISDFKGRCCNFKNICNLWQWTLSIQWKNMKNYKWVDTRDVLCS